MVVYEKASAESGAANEEDVHRVDSVIMVMAVAMMLEYHSNSAFTSSSCSLNAFQ